MDYGSNEHARLEDLKKLYPQYSAGLPDFLYGSDLNDWCFSYPLAIPTFARDFWAITERSLSTIELMAKIMYVKRTVESQRRFERLAIPGTWDVDFEVAILSIEDAERWLNHLDSEEYENLVHWVEETDGETIYENWLPFRPKGSLALLKLVEESDELSALPANH